MIPNAACIRQLNKNQKVVKEESAERIVKGTRETQIYNTYISLIFYNEETVIFEKY
jgi:hypothetical protein